MYYFFFAPLGTELRVRRFPFAVLSLAIINFAYFILFHYSPEHAARAGALAFDTQHPGILTAFTACFLHADWFHLIGNMAYLLTFGPAIEDRLTGPRFLLFYLVTGMGGMAIQMMLNASGSPLASGEVIVGASGAISGILGLFVIRCGFARVRVAHVTMALTQGLSRAGTTRINGYVAIGAWFALQVIYALVAGPKGGVAYGSHIGGLLIGVFLGLAIGLHNGAMVEYIWLRARRHADRGEWFAALGETVSYTKRAPWDTDGWLQLARLQRVLGRPAEAVAAYSRAVDRLWRLRRRHESVRAARELRRHYPQARLRPALLYRLGLHLERHGDLGWASHTLEDYARYYPGHERAPSALLRAAQIEARLRNDLERAGTIYRELAERYPHTREGEEAAKEAGAVERINVNRSWGAGSWGDDESQERTAS